MKKLKYFLFLTAYLLISNVYLNHLQLFGIIPNINVILVVIVGLLGGNMNGVFVGAYIGLFEDIAFSDSIGISALVYMYIGYAAALISKKINPENQIFIILTVGIADLVHNVAMFSYHYMHITEINFMAHLWRTYIPEMIYTMAMTIIVLKLKEMAGKYILF